MPISDVIAIATLAIAICGIVYAFGTRDNRLGTLEKDVNGFGKKIDKFDSRLDKISEFTVRIDQRVAQLQDECFGEQKTNRLRENQSDDQHYTTINEHWYSENSGIEL